MILENEDCLSFLRRLPGNSVDLVVVDPPYFRISPEKWDNQWDTEEQYLRWCWDWTTELARALKPGGCLYVWGTTKTDTFLRYKLYTLNAMRDLVYQSWVIWSYDWGGRTKKNFARKHEDLLMYSKGQEFTFNADAVRIPYKMSSNIRERAKNNPLGKIPTDVWEKNNHTTSREYVNWHSTQKPLELLKRIILTHTEPGQVVLDCFSGSGSTAIAARECGREFVGCELDPTYHQKSLQRISEWFGDE